MIASGELCHDMLCVVTSCDITSHHDTHVMTVVCCYVTSYHDTCHDCCVSWRHVTSWHTCHNCCVSWRHVTSWHTCYDCCVSWRHVTSWHMSRLLCVMMSCHNCCVSWRHVTSWHTCHDVYVMAWHDVMILPSVHTPHDVTPSYRYGIIPPDAKCGLCQFPLLTKGFYLFPCHHTFHSDCLIQELMQNLPSHER